MPKHVVIVGNGIAGVTCARFVRKLRSDYAITLVSAETDHHYARTALMYLYMGHMKYQDLKPYEDAFWPKNRIDLVRGWVEAIDVDHRQLHLRDAPPLAYDVLVLATGSKPRRGGWPGEDARGVQGLYGLPDLEAMEQHTRERTHVRAVVVGGGLIGVEMAEMLHTRRIPVTFLVREPSYMSAVLPPEEGDLVGREIARHGIDLRLSTELREIVPGADGQVQAVVTSDGEEIPCGFVGLTIGVEPNVEVVARSPVETRRGVLVNRFFETNVPDVYAIGDCAEFQEDGVGAKPIEQLWYTARAHGKTVAYTICGHPTPYARGVFFNSAKFFTLEYQTYGDVRPGPPEGVGTLVWQHPKAPKLIRLDYDLSGGHVLGVNVLGIRYRQAVCEAWIKARRAIDFVIDHLPDANFDPEFAPRVERKAQQHFRSRLRLALSVRTLER